MGKLESSTLLRGLLAALSAIPRTHHSADGSAARTPTGARSHPELEPRARERRVRCLVRGSVLEYYSDDPTDASKNGEDAYDMRKPLKRDVERKHVRENGEEFEVDPSDVW
ncbi:acyltransferase [Chlorociboria aeruginascens]|nr:acyltransferase [Chlorociboria aeruginascens]